jgi:asparagine synthase (glutamine-hydrolysing)
MSGICAVWRKDGAGTGRDLNAMTQALSISGPERASLEIDGSVGVGVSALWNTQQLYRNEGILVACHADLCREDELWKHCDERRGAADKGCETAALIAALYERFGCGCVEKLRGSFSLILWDGRRRLLLAAIDGFAMNRLVYYEDPKVLLVSTRIDSLVRFGHIPVEVNPRAIANVLNFSVNLAPETAIKKVFRLLPGTFLAASEKKTEIKQYWDMRYGLVDGTSEPRLSRELESVVETSVAAHCKSDPIPCLGAFLSGGTDSSTVVGMMDRAGRGPVKAFSIGFREERFNELEYAVITARKFGARHHSYLVGPEDCVDALPGMVRAFDEPFANSSAIPTYFCAKLAADSGTRVLLAGDGGDELFGGNERYATDKVFGAYQRLPQLLRRCLVEPAVALMPGNVELVRKARKYIERSNIPALERFFSYHFLCAHPPADVFDSDFIRTLDGYSVLDAPTRYYWKGPATDHLDRLLYVDVKITLGDSDLPKVTCMSEMAGVQVRFPFLDRSVAEFSGRLPAGLKVKGFEKRYLFKQAFRNLLPPQVIRKTKHGFGLPVSGWLKSDPSLHELATDTLFSTRAFERGYFKRAFIEDLFRKYEADDSTYYGDTVWTFLVLELWHRQVVDEAAKVTA